MTKLLLICKCNEKISVKSVEGYTTQQSNSSVYRTGNDELNARRLLFSSRRRLLRHCFRYHKACLVSYFFLLVIAHTLVLQHTLTSNSKPSEHNSNLYWRICETRSFDLWNVSVWRTLHIKIHSHVINKNVHDIILQKYKIQYNVYHFITCFNLRNSSYIDIRVGEVPLSLDFRTHSCEKILLTHSLP